MFNSNSNKDKRRFMATSGVRIISVDVKLLRGNTRVGTHGENWPNSILAKAKQCLLSSSKVG